MSSNATSSVSSRTTHPYAYAYGYLDSAVEMWISNARYWMVAFPRTNLAVSALEERLLSLAEIRKSISLTIVEGYRSSDYRAEYTTLRAIALRMLCRCEQLVDEIAEDRTINVRLLREGIDEFRARIEMLIK